MTEPCTSPLAGPSRSNGHSSHNNAHISSGSAIASGSATASGNEHHVKLYRPYFSPTEIEQLSAKQRGKLSVSREERMRQQACAFIDAVGVRCGFPRKTIATAQTLYMRFHLFFPYKDFRYMEVSLSTLYVSSKLHDTLKKPRDIILASYPIRYPHLVKKSSGSGSGGSTAGGAGGGGVLIDPAAIDLHALESERSRVLGIERLVLEGVCFMFGVQGMEDGVKVPRALGLNKDLTMLAWRSYIDSYRTLAPLTFPSHTLALGATYACALLSLESTGSSSSGDESRTGGMSETQCEWQRITDLLGNPGTWEDRWSSTAQDVDDIAHAIIDLHMVILSTPLSDPQHTLVPSPSSPREAPGVASSSSSLRSSASANSANHQNTISNTAFKLGSFWTMTTLTELKIRLRERRPVRVQTNGHATGNGIGNGTENGTLVDAMEYGIGDGAIAEGSNGANTGVDEMTAGLGKNDGTVRFVWAVET